MLARMWRNWKFHTCWWEHQMVQSLWWTSLVSKKKFYFHLTYICYISRYYPREMEIMSIKRFIYSVHRSFIYNIPKEISQMSTNRWMNKPAVAHPYSGVLLSNRKKWAIDTLEMDESQLRCVWERTGKIEYMSPLNKTLESEN